MTDLIPMQKNAIIIGDAGCYFCCIVKAAEILRHNNIDLMRAFAYCEQQKTNGTKWIESDGYVNFPDKILGYLINKNVTVIKCYDLNYKPAENEILIGMWEWYDQKNNKTRQHFGYIDDNKNLIYDPLGESNTIKFGKLTSIRIFTIK